MSRRIIDCTDEDGNFSPGLYPLLEGTFGAGSLDAGNEDPRFNFFVNGSSELGLEVAQAWSRLQAMVSPENVGPLSRPAEALRPMSKEIGKLQNDITVQIEGYNAAALPWWCAMRTSKCRIGDALPSRSAYQARPRVSQRRQRGPLRFRSSFSRVLWLTYSALSIQ